MSVIALVSISRCLCALTSYELTAPQDVPPVYNLFAISQHSGSLGGGHYTATVQYEGRDWYEFNDTGVSRVDDMDPADSAHSAYVLFYRRQDDLRSSPSKPTNLTRIRSPAMLCHLGNHMCSAFWLSLPMHVT